MKEAKFTYQDYLESPPTPYTDWDSDTIRMWLQLKGFDLSKPISREEDQIFKCIIFRQKEYKK